MVNLRFYDYYDHNDQNVKHLDCNQVVVSDGANALIKPGKDKATSGKVLWVRRLTQALRPGAI